MKVEDHLHPKEVGRSRPLVLNTKPVAIRDEQQTFCTSGYELTGQADLMPAKYMSDKKLKVDGALAPLEKVVP